jgi:hypothetical protein
MIILLVTIGGYFIDGDCWVCLLLAIDDYFISDY